ncbi:TetR/AcrR family transcriptional regulator [Nonomuraea sp. JJY05]|uniref:TetR/AcrR family transcriptional regulator n=1 Tax=Nonomuraea sp. JJY05 TaxID=3350255 RepID=UPI00373E1322
MNETPRRIPTGERAARKRAAIIRAARTVFVGQGFGSGMDRIAAEANVSKVTVYNHFRSKEELFLEVIGDALEQALGRSFRAMSEHLRDGGDIRDLLLRTARSWVEGMTRADVQALRTLIAAQVQRFPELGRAWREQGPDRFSGPLGEALSKRDDLDIPDMPLALTQFYALVLYPHVVHSAYGDRLDADFTEQLITTGVDMFLTYYRAKPPE